MTAWRTALRSKILTISQVSEQTMGNVNFNKVIDNASSKAQIRITVVSDVRPKHYKGYQGLRSSRIYIDVYHQTSSKDASDLAELIIPIISVRWTDDNNHVRFEPATCEGPEDGGDQEKTIYKYNARLDCDIWHALTQ